MIVFVLKIKTIVVKYFDEISYLPNRRLDLCYTGTINNNTISFLYHCGNTELDKEQVLFLPFQSLV